MILINHIRQLIDEIDKELIISDLSKSDADYVSKLKALKKELIIKLFNEYDASTFYNLLPSQIFELMQKDKTYLDRKKINSSNVMRFQRLKLDYTKELAANLIGISYAAYNAIENQKKLPSIPVAKKIGYVLLFDWWLLFDRVEIYETKGVFFDNETL